MNELKIFENPVFGKIRTIDVDGKIHFVASDVAKALKYRNPSEAINDHCRWVAKCYIPHPQSKTASNGRSPRRYYSFRRQLHSKIRVSACAGVLASGSAFRAMTSAAEIEDQSKTY